MIYGSPSILLTGVRRQGAPHQVLLRVLILAGSVSLGVVASGAEDRSLRLSFNKDIAPIVFQNCASCHRPGQSAPFSLLTYSDVKKHGQQIVEVTGRRYMPPWLPQPGYGEFVGVRRLTAEQMARIERWLLEGAVEGDVADLPPLPQWSADWQLGVPDLVIQIPQPYALAADGRDVYRNGVVPIPNAMRRFVRGVEFQPGNSKVMHHAFINVDETRQSRRLAESHNPPGFDGMELPDSAVMPGGQLLGWQPGKVPRFSPEGLAWLLKTNVDLVLQMHLHPSGKPERVQPSVGFYFTDQVPTNQLNKLSIL